MSNKKIPGWYRVYLEKKLRKLKNALKWLDLADKTLEEGFPHLAKIDFNIAKRILNQ